MTHLQSLICPICILWVLLTVRILCCIFCIILWVHLLYNNGINAGLVDATPSKINQTQYLPFIWIYTREYVCLCLCVLNSEYYVWCISPNVAFSKPSMHIWIWMTTGWIYIRTHNKPAPFGNGFKPNQTSHGWVWTQSNEFFSRYEVNNEFY